MKSNKGFTLVEMLITILAAALITGAATTVLLLGMRINQKTNAPESGQNSVRIAITLLEDMAAEQCTGVEGDKVMKADGVLFSLDGNTLYIGDNNSGTPILSNVTQFSAKMVGELLKMEIEVNGETYKSSVYCRLVPPTTESISAEAQAASASRYLSAGALTVKSAGTFSGRARQAFLEILLAEEGSTGRSTTGEYYSEWYIGSYADNPAWGPETPWCACFISWALDQCADYLKEVPRYAHVDKFMESFGKTSWKTTNPQPGDIIFFDWIVDDTEKAQHVGVVVSTDGEYVYTIEGNSGGKVAACRYKLDDPFILGYGELKWK